MSDVGIIDFFFFVMNDGVLKIIYWYRIYIIELEYLFILLSY